MRIANIKNIQIKLREKEYSSILKRYTSWKIDKSSNTLYNNIPCPLCEKYLFTYSTTTCKGCPFYPFHKLRIPGCMALIDELLTNYEKRIFDASGDYENEGRKTCQVGFKSVSFPNTKTGKSISRKIGKTLRTKFRSKER